MCSRCGGRGYIEAHIPGYTHYETDAGEPCPSYHFRRAVCPVCFGSLGQYLKRQEEWSARTFGHSTRTKELLEHIRKELAEIEAAPHDLTEWVDVIILALDGYWRHGGSPDSIMAALQAKQDKNFARKWPTPKSEDEAVEHIR